MRFINASHSENSGGVLAPLTKSHSAEIRWNGVRQQGLACCLVWSHMPRKIKIFQRRESVSLLQFTRCVMKNTLHEYIIFHACSSERIKHFKAVACGGRGTMTSTSRSPPESLSPWCPKVTAPSGAPQQGNPRRSKV